MKPSRTSRRTVFVKAQMRDDLDWAEIGIGNISNTGMMVKCSHPPTIGAEVEIRRRSVRIIGRVMWTSRSRFGLQSNEPIDVETLLQGAGLQPKQAETSRPPKPRLWHWSWAR